MCEGLGVRSLSAKSEKGDEKGDDEKGDVGSKTT